MDPGGRGELIIEGGGVRFELSPTLLLGNRALLGGVLAGWLVSSATLYCCVPTRFWPWYLLWAPPDRRDQPLDQYRRVLSSRSVLLLYAALGYEMDLWYLQTHGRYRVRPARRDPRSNSRSGRQQEGWSLRSARGTRVIRPPRETRTQTGRDARVPGTHVAMRTRSAQCGRGCPDSEALVGTG